VDYKDYYKLMGVDRGASQDEIKRAYRKLARKYHPDVSKAPDAELRFKELGEAYAVLKDPEKRAAYDELGANWKAGQDFQPPPDWGSGFEFSGSGFDGADAGAHSDFFEQLFGRGMGAQQQAGPIPGFRASGEDHHAKVLVDLEDAYNGATRAISLRTPELDATGHVITKDRTLNVKIPKGVKQGQKIRLSGQGSAGHGGGKAGDLYLEIEFRPHRYYKPDGKDVFLVLPITPWEAALGATIKVPTPSGPVDLKIPAGTGSGKKLRLKGRGIPSSPPGDFYVTTEVTLPPADSDAEKEIYRTMQQEMPYNPRGHLEVATS
jgi:curved DNA-binding protein